MDKKDHPYRLKQWTAEEVAQKLDILHNPRVYLAHSLGTRHHVKDVIQPALEKAGISIFNPFADRPYLYELDSSLEREVLLANEKNKHTSEMIVEGDLNDVNESDALIAYVTKPSFGMAMEIFEASRNSSMQVWVLFEDPDNDLNFHPWLDYLTMGAIVL